MAEEIERLLELGRMDLEAGYPQYAREYFEKVLALDASNREATEALARIDTLLSRRVAVKPVEAEIRTEPSLAEKVSLQAGSALECIRKERKEYADRFAERRRLEAQEREEQARQIARQREEKQRTTEKRRIENKQWYGKMICNRCSYQWQSRRHTPPARCPKCGTRDISPILESPLAGCATLVAIALLLCICTCWLCL